MGGSWPRVVARALTGVLLGLGVGALATAAAMTLTMTNARPQDCELAPGREGTVQLVKRRMAESDESKRLGRGATGGRRDAALEPLPWPVALLGTAGVESHDPEVLMARALRLQADGLDMTIEHRSLRPEELEGAALAGMSVGPLERFGSVVGLVVRSAPPGSVLRRLGLASGDLLASVNGHALTSPEVALWVYARVTDKRRAVLELVRDGRRVVVMLEAQ